MASLYDQKLITQETALAYASHRAIVGRSIDELKSARGETTSDIERLEVDSSYNKKR
jgi:twitching motility protein PilT